MQSFLPPKHKLCYKNTTLESLLKETSFSFFPIYNITFLVPGSETCFNNLQDVLKSADDVYFTVKDITAIDLVDEVFVESFIKKGTISAFSYKTNVDIENSLAIIPPGKLILSLEKEISRCLSLQKVKKPGTKKKSKDIFEICSIDISKDDFSPGKKLYNSVLSELHKLSDIKFDILLQWKPSDNICPESLRAYFESKNLTCITCEPSYKCQTNLSVLSPLIDLTSVDSERAEDILEWIGAQICLINVSKQEDRFISSFSVPEPTQIIKILQIGSFQGLYSREKIQTILNKIRTVFEENPSVPFITLTLTGYQNCYMVCKGFEKFSSEDKIICIVISSNMECWLTSLNVT